MCNNSAGVIFMNKTCFPQIFDCVLILIQHLKTTFDKGTFIDI